MERPAKLFADARSRWLVLAASVVIFGVLLSISLLFQRELAWLTDPPALRTFLLDFGVFAPFAFVFLQAGQVLLAPIPGQILALTSGWLFGSVWGTVYSLTGATLGSFVAFALARRYGRPFVERVIDGAALSQFDTFSSDHGLLALYLVFLVPGLPDDVICFVAGTTELDIRWMTAVSLFGRLPGYVLINHAGASLTNGHYAEAVVILLVLVTASIGVILRRDALLDRLLGRQR